MIQEENVIKNCLEGYDNINYIPKIYKNNSIDYDNMEKSYEGCTLCHYLNISRVIGLGNKDDFLIELIWEGCYCEYAKKIFSLFR